MSVAVFGDAGPVALLSAGLGSGIDAWHRLAARLPDDVRYVAYDRAGWGSSSPGPLPRVVSATVSDLGEALMHLRLEPPYHLVAHSAGAFDALFLAFTRPNHIASMLLLDPSMPHMGRALFPISERLRRERRDEQDATLQDIERLQAGPVARLSDALIRLECQTSEIDSFYDGSSDEIEASWTCLGDMPLLVLTCLRLAVDDQEHGAVLEAWRQAHERYRALSTIGALDEVDIGHEQIVAHAIDSGALAAWLASSVGPAT